MEGSPNSGPRGHSRNKSLTKGYADARAPAARPKSVTKGPLDLDDSPLSSPSRHSTPIPTRLAKPPNRYSLSRQGSPMPPSSRGSPISESRGPRVKDFSFLLRPDIYHPLTPINVPLAFRNSPRQPPADSPLQELLSKGFYRAAATAAAQELTSTSPNAPRIDPLDHRRIFELLYIRLSCLTLIDATPLAAQEVKAFEDMNNPAVYIDEATGEHLVPWELRVLNVRLQALGFGDPRRAVMSYHDLAREARGRIAAATASGDNSAREMWKGRLFDLGIKVAGALVEMEDLSGAAELLRGMKERGDGRVVLARALLWLHLGNAGEARRVVAEGGGGELAEGVVLALADMADGDCEGALDKWRALLEKHEESEGSENEMVGINMAVCLLYMGRMEEARAVLEGLVDRGFSSHTLLSNLSTIYELCTERNKKSLKLGLAEKVASMEESERGWEKANADFKL